MKHFYVLESIEEDEGSYIVIHESGQIIFKATNEDQAITACRKILRPLPNWVDYEHAMLHAMLLSLSKASDPSLWFVRVDDCGAGLVIDDGTGDVVLAHHDVQVVVGIVLLAREIIIETK